MVVWFGWIGAILWISVLMMAAIAYRTGKDERMDYIQLSILYPKPEEDFLTPAPARYADHVENYEEYWTDEQIKLGEINA